MQAQTLGAMLRETVSRFGSKVGYMVPGKTGYSCLTYEEVYTTVRRHAGALQGLGLKKGDRLAILAESCPEWSYVDWACQCLGIVVVPIYPTLPADQVDYIVRDSGAIVVVAGDDKQAEKTKCLEIVRTILLKDPSWSASEPLEVDPFIDATNAEDVATIIYTSGTTGTPKGVMLPHRAFLHVCHGAKKYIPLDENDVFLSFLPMSHVFERVAGQVLPVYLGCTLAYSKNLASLANDIVAVKPTAMLCVPRFLESMRDRILDKVAKDKPIKQKLFAWAVSQGTKKAKGEFAPFAGLLDKLVGTKIRERTGGRLRFFVSGGAALAPLVAEFYMAMGLTVLQGYGLTETTGGTCVNRVDNNRYWTVGEPLDMDVKIAEDGEILIKGPALMLGYYNLPEETSQAIDADGWFHTGDIGEFEGKNLKITDRKKDILVLGNGKNVAPQPIENRLKESPYISEAVLFGDGMDACVALIVPKFEAVRHHLHLGDDVRLSENAEAKALVKKEIDRINKSLASYEMVKKHALLDEPFSIESGELTPSLKVRRKVVRNKYLSVINSLG
jgi:long-chain acyl-CoA synthetase